jgi:hypothetical protein
MEGSSFPFDDYDGAWMDFGTGLQLMRYAVYRIGSTAVWSLRNRSERMSRVQSKRNWTGELGVEVEFVIEYNLVSDFLYVIKCVSWVLFVFVFRAR